MDAYLHLNSTLNNNTYNILFHDSNPFVGNFKPLVHKRQIGTIESHKHDEYTIKYENIEQKWAQIQNKMLENGFERVCEFTSAYGESSFETTLHLTHHEYDLPFFKHIF